MPLPWPLEAVFWFLGLVCIPLAMWWFVGEITTPAATFAKSFNVQIDLSPIIAACKPMTLIFGIIFGLKVRFAVRRWFVRRVEAIC